MGLALARQFAVRQKSGHRVVPLVLFLIFMRLLAYTTHNTTMEASDAEWNVMLQGRGSPPRP